jgi:hypothetical protein
MTVLLIIFCLLMVVLTVTLCWLFLLAPGKVIADTCPKERPRLELFWSKDPTVSDLLITYYGVRCVLIFWNFVIAIYLFYVFRTFR